MSTLSCRRKIPKGPDNFWVRQRCSERTSGSAETFRDCLLVNLGLAASLGQEPGRQAIRRKPPLAFTNGESCRSGGLASPSPWEQMLKALAMQREKAAEASSFHLAEESGIAQGKI